jgi:hypothetical protein
MQGKNKLVLTDNRFGATSIFKSRYFSASIEVMYRPGEFSPFFEVGSVSKILEIPENYFDDMDEPKIQSYHYLYSNFLIYGDKKFVSLEALQVMIIASKIKQIKNFLLWISRIVHHSMVIYHNRYQ